MSITRFIYSLALILILFLFGCHVDAQANNLSYEVDTLANYIDTTPIYSSLETDQKFYEEQVQIDFEQQNLDKIGFSNIRPFSLNGSAEFQEFIDKKKFNDTLTTTDYSTNGYSLSSNIVQNGNFELGHNSWKEWYLGYDGWYLANYIISSGSGGYGSWYAYMYSDDWLESNTSTLPSNTVDLYISYSYRLVYWGSCSNAYGTNGVGVRIVDTNTDAVHVVNAHDPTFDPYNYEYVSTSFYASDLASISSVAGHNVYIDFAHFSDDPNCTIAFYLDNVSVEPVLYVPDYQISTSSGSNGTITSSQTVTSGSSFTVNVTPNSGYQIADVQIDGVSVGPIKYYTFSNIESSHTVFASFEPRATATKRVYRFWSDQNQTHFYTSNDDELTLIVNSYTPYVWKYEHVAYKSFPNQGSGSVPLHRFWSDQNQSHFYTASETEKNLIISTYSEFVWRYEGVAFYVYPESTSTSSNPIYRFWSDQNQSHFYTASESEKNLIIETYPQNVWRYEGIAFKTPN